MSVKISATRLGGRAAVDRGITREVLARLLVDHGCDAVTSRPGNVPTRTRDTVVSTNASASHPVRSLHRHDDGGNIASPDDVNSILAAGRSDLCVRARGHLYDPYWRVTPRVEQVWELEWPQPVRVSQGFHPRLR